jgi:hypothetical protein
VLDSLKHSDIAYGRADQLADKLDQGDIIACETPWAGLIRKVQNAHNFILAQKRGNKAVFRPVIAGVWPLRLFQGHLGLRVNVVDVNELFAFGGDNHRRRRILIQRDDFVDEIRVVIFLEMKHIAGVVKNVEGGKAGIEKLGNLSDADCADTLDIKAVYLPGQRRYLLKQRNSGGAGFGVFVRFGAMSSHNAYMLTG